MKKQDELYYEFLNISADSLKSFLDLPDEFIQPPQKKFVLKQSAEDKKINNFVPFLFILFSVFGIVDMLANDKFDKYYFGAVVILFALGLICMCYSCLNAKKSVVEFVEGTFEIKGKEYHYSDDIRLMINNMEDLKIMYGEKELIKVSPICEGGYEMIRWMRYYHVPIIDTTKEAVKKDRKKKQRKEIISSIFVIIMLLIWAYKVYFGHGEM